MLRLAALSLALLLAASSQAQAPRATAISIGDAWTRPTVAGATNAVGYLTISNAAPTADRLLGGSTPVAAKLEIHQSTDAGGVMRMREITGGVSIPPHATIAFAPNGYHLMLVAPKRRLRPGDRIPAVLRFAKAGAVTATLVVRSGAAMPPMKMQ